MKRFAGKIAITAGLLAIIAGAAFALPPSRQGPVDSRTGRYFSTGQKAPQFPRELLLPRLSPQGGKYPYSPKASAAARAGVRPLAINPAPGSSVRPLVVLLDFADKQHTQQRADFVPLFFDNVSPALSVANYWKEVSYGKFTVNFDNVSGGATDIVGWVRPVAIPTLPGEFVSTITSYSQITDPLTGVNLPNLSKLIGNLVTYLDNTRNLAPYADPATGVVQSLIILHAGTGREDTGLPADLYSHEATLGGGPFPTKDTVNGHPVTVADYIAVPELLSFDPATGANIPVRITPGVIVHEMGHLLGLPDLYPVSGTAGQIGKFSGVGVFDLMGYGLWGSNFLDRPDNPAHLSAWSKAFLGWLTPTLRTETIGLTLLPVEEFLQADKVYSNTVADPGQYFLVENRQVSSTPGAWLFDKFLPAPTGGGAGILIWQIDDSVIQPNLSKNTVNVDNAFRGVYIKEADGVYHMALPIPAGNPNAQAIYYGIESDYFNESLLNGEPRVFSRTLPSTSVDWFNSVNSTPIISAFHPKDFGADVAMSGFVRRIAGEMAYLLTITPPPPPPPPPPPAWKTFNVASTTVAYPTPMRSNDILSLGFDSGNNTWMGSREQGIFRFLGSDFSILNTLQGLPGPGTGAPTGATVASIQAMTFEAATGSMWVGTDRGLYKMRDSGSGFRVVGTSSTGSLGIPGNRIPQGLAPALNDIRSLALRGGFESAGRAIDLKYAATPVGLLRIDDLNNDPASDDIVSTILAGDVTAVAVDSNGTPTAADDVVWVGFADGTFTRSLQPGESGAPPNNDPVGDGNFLAPRYTLNGSPKVTSLAVDNRGIVWIGTDDRGIQAFDLRDNLTPPGDNLRDPYDFKGDGILAKEAYLNFNVVADVDGVFGSNKVTGIGFESAGLPLPVAWISQQSVNVSSAFNRYVGGASRFNANLPLDNTLFHLDPPRDSRLKVYSPLPPTDVPTAFDRSSSVSAVAGDSAGNVWFATTQPAISSFPYDQANGVVRFGSAGTLSLDRSNYLNTTAVARVTLQDDGLNTSENVVDTASVRVSSTTDAAGFDLTLAETGINTGVFTGTFGFTNGTTDKDAHLISVKSGGVVTVTYKDSDPPGFRTATATWKSVFPFSDSLFIDDFSCFIATAAYGSAMSPEVVSFRAFRDRYLMGHAAGRAFVDLYYLASPAAAAAIARSPALRAVARFALVPAANISSFAVSTSPAEKALVLFLLLVAAGGVAALRGSRRGRGR